VKQRTSCLAVLYGFPLFLLHFFSEKKMPYIVKRRTACLDILYGFSVEDRGLPYFFNFFSEKKCLTS
jgi:hypothetical protein